MPDRRRRVLRVAASGSGHKEGFHITRDDGGLFAFAGLWSIWYRDDGTKLRSCTILTAPANPAIAPLHDRMPVILEPDRETAWLDHATPRKLLFELLGGLPAERTALRAVAPAVNDARYDGPECLAPPVAAGQEALF
jgi:putative SOS response-associated peptidase YedK